MNLFGRLLSGVVPLALTGPGPASGQEAEVGLVSRIKERRPKCRQRSVLISGGLAGANRHDARHYST
jgi:hypothetical protein